MRAGKIQNLPHSAVDHEDRPCSSPRDQAHMKSVLFSEAFFGLIRFGGFVQFSSIADLILLRLCQILGIQLRFESAKRAQDRSLECIFGELF
jgi:hypothetical protein